MCVAIYKPEKVQLTKRDMVKCFRANSDGVGFSYIEDGVAKIHKGFFNFKDFWKAFKAYQTRECIVHFRWTTHGTTDVDNCHPFVLANGGALIHNGVIEWASSSIPQDPRSDTRIFVEDFLNPVIQDGASIHAPEVQEDIEKAIGPTNKMILLYQEAVIILNQHLGSWHNGAWFSNLYWQSEGLPWRYVAGTPKSNYFSRSYESRGYRTDYDMLDIDEEDEPYEHRPYDVLENIYTQCRVCFAWKPEDSLLHMGTEPICYSCFDREYEVDHPITKLSDHPRYL